MYLVLGKIKDLQRYYKVKDSGKQDLESHYKKDIG